MPLDDGQKRKRRDQDRYYRVLEDELERLNLTEAEALALIDITDGISYSGLDYHSLGRSLLKDRRLSGLEEKWEIDGKALADKIRDLSPGGSMAVLDAIERFRGLNRETDLPRDQLLREVGLL